MNPTCLFIDIIGSMPDENENTNKIDGYYQVTKGFLIRNFVLKLFNIKEVQVKIFAFGDEHFYDPFIHTNDKCYCQFGLNDFFQMEAGSRNLKFKYFIDFKTVIDDINTTINTDKYASVIMFLDDHGSKGKFSRMNYFQLYQIFLKYPRKQFFFFNDSCYSGCLISLIETYNKIYELKINKGIRDEICLPLIFSFAKLVKSILKEKDQKYFNDEITNLIDLYQKFKISDQNRFNNLLHLLSSDDISNEKIREIGFQNIEEIHKYQLIYNSFYLNEILAKDENEKYKRYLQSLEVFQSSNIEIINNLINKDLQEFINTIDILDACKENLNFKLPPSQNFEIITSTDDKSKCFSYTSIRINSVTKVNPGSPAMGGFLKEVFMNHEKILINFDTIQKEMCGTEEDTIYYSVKEQKKTSKGHVKIEWANLFPRHYKSNQQDILSLSFCEGAKKNIAALRDISSIITRKFKDAASKLSSEKDLNINIPNTTNDTFADMVAIASFVDKDSNIKEIIDQSVNANKFYIKHEPFGISILLPIIEFAFYSSKDHIQMMAVIMNCINEAIQKEIHKSIDLIDKNSKLEISSLRCISKNEISYFYETEIDNKNKGREENNNNNNEKDDKRKSKENKKLEILNEIRNAVFALLKPSSTFFAYIVASSILDDINIESILNSNFISCSSDDNYAIFLQKENINSLKELKFRKLAEHYLFSHVKLSFDTLNSICDMHIKNDVMKIVVKGLQNQSSLFWVRVLTENIDNDEINSLFIKNIIEPIKCIIESMNIPTFFIPAIIEFLPPKAIICTLYASLSNLQDNFFDKVINIFKNVIQNSAKNSTNYQYINEDKMLELVKDALNKQKDICDISEYNSEVIKIQENYKKEIQLSIKKIQKLNEISVKRVRGNISRMMNMDILINRISSNCCNFFNEVNNYHDQFHEYLYSSISDYLSEVDLYMKKAVLDINLKEEFDDIELLKNTEDLYKRAANELNTVAYIFSISDESLHNSNEELSEIIKSDEINFEISVMLARALNIVEMSPISCLLKSYSGKFKSEQGNNPNIKELMGLLGANIFLLSEKDEKRKRSKIDHMKNVTIKNNEGKEERYFECEYDSYYSSDDDFDDVPYRPTQTKSGKSNFSICNKLPRRLWHKDQISQIIIGDIQRKLKIGSSCWTYDAWIAFIYCFNERMKDIKLYFNPDDDYKNEIYYFNIDEAKSIIDSFYPLYRIIDFWTNEYKFQLFVGKNMNKAKEIFRAMIRAFDDADRIVTPIHMFRETYEERTSETLSRIFDY